MKHEITRSTFANTAYRLINNRMFQTSKLCSELVQNGQIEEALDILRSAPARSARWAIMDIVNNMRPENRAPSYQLQVAFFTKAKDTVTLSKTDNFRLNIALAYNAVEAQDDRILNLCKMTLSNQLTQTEVTSAPRGHLHLRKKRGHHFHYSTLAALMHVLLALNEIQFISSLACRCQKFFEEDTYPNKDLGFGYGGTNAIKILALGIIIEANGSSKDMNSKLHQMLGSMKRMLKLIYSGDVGPLDFRQFYRACLLVDSIEHSMQTTSWNIEDNARRILRLRNPKSFEQCLENLKSLESLKPAL